jgi:hypothetical protein
MCCRHTWKDNEYRSIREWITVFFFKQCLSSAYNSLYITRLYAYIEFVFTTVAGFLHCGLSESPGSLSVA